MTHWEEILATLEDQGDARPGWLPAPAAGRRRPWRRTKRTGIFGPSAPNVRSKAPWRARGPKPSPPGHGGRGRNEPGWRSTTAMRQHESRSF